MADKIVAEYTVKVDLALKNLDKLAARVDKVDDERKKTQAGFKTMSKNIVGSMAKVGAAMGLAFGTQQLVSFGKEAVKLASQAEGIERAFKRVGSADLLADLRKATRGTVNDLELMKKAVQASNFKVPLDQLAGLFKFAAARARETGEDVDFLVNSIVLGIGRKSPLILDNLGISAVELRTRLKGVGVEAANVADIAAIVGQIATEELAKMGEQADTTADKLAQLNTRYDNIQVIIGTQLILALDQLADAWDLTAESELKALDGFDDYKDSAIDGMIPIIGPLSKVGQLWQFVASNMRLVVDVASDVKDELIKAAHRLTLNNDELVDYLKLSDSAQLITAKLALEISDYADVTGDAEKATELFNKQFVEQDPIVEKAIRNLAFYNDLIKTLRVEQEASNTTRARVRQIEEEINEAIRQRLLLLGKLREVGGESFEEIDPIESTELLDQQQLTDDILADYAHRNEEIKKGQDELDEYRREKDAEYAQEQAELYMDTFSVISGLVGTLADLQANKGRQEIANLQEQLDARLISEEEFSIKKRQILSQEAEDQKGYAIFQATINTAQAVVAALGSQPFTPANIALAAAVGVAGAVQIGLIASQPTPSFATGVIDLQGAGTGTSDSIDAKLSKGESVMTAKETMQHKDIFNAIRGGSWEKYKMENIITPAINQVLEGGFAGMGASYTLQGGFNDRNLLSAFDRNRRSEKDSAVFIVGELKQAFKGRKRGNFD